MVKDGDGKQYFETICCMLGNAKDARESDGATHILFMINKQNLGTVLRVLEYMFRPKLNKLFRAILSRVN